MLTQLGAGVCIGAGESRARRHRGRCGTNGAVRVHRHGEAADGGTIVPDGEDAGLDEAATRLGENVQQAPTNKPCSKVLRW